MAEQFQKKYRLGEFEIEPDKRLLKRKNKSVHLAYKPFSVLLYLIENRNRLVTRQELLDLYWDGCDVYDVTLSKCIGAIRKALREKSDNPRFIETRWSEGYRYIGPLEEEILDNSTSSESQATKPREKPKGELSDEDDISLETPTSFLGYLLYLKRSRPVFLSIILGLMILLVSGAALVYYRFPFHSKETTPVRSVAVLPLKNLSGDPANEYFSDGLTESLITALSKIDGLKVISRSSVFRFKGKNVTPEEAGKTLGVAAVLEGSVRQDENYVQATVRLVSVLDGSVLWSNESNRRSISDIFILQDEIARNIAAGLKVKLSGANEEQLTKRYTENVEAYQIYLKGRYLWNKRTVESLKKSIEYYEKAIEKDPKYALAYTGLADCYQLLAEYLATTPKEGFTKAKEAATKALEIDDQLAEAHTSLAYTLAFYEWDFVGAEREFKRALELNPNYATAHQWYGEFLVAMGRFDEALREHEISLQVDPTSLILQIDLAAYYYTTRQFDKAIAQLNKVIEMEPGFAYSYVFLSFSLGQKGMKQEAAEAYIKSVELFGETKEAEALRKVLTEKGIKAMWLKRIEQVDASARRDSFSAEWRSMIYIWIGDKEKALYWLERAYERRDRWVINMKYSPEMDFLRSEPRFQKLIARVGL